jgi:uncharacterized protein (TIGR03067 family)
MRTIIGVVSFSLFFTAPAFPQEDALKTEMARLQGEWKVVDAQVTEGLEYGKFDGLYFQEVEGKWWVFASRTLKGRGGREIGTAGPSAPLKIDPTKKPKTMDITVRLGEERRTELYIYQLDGDTLTIHRAYKADTRPTDFTYKKGDTALFTLKRVPK